MAGEHAYSKSCAYIQYILIYNLLIILKSALLYFMSRLLSIHIPNPIISYYELFHADLRSTFYHDLLQSTRKY